ncbi:MAG: T9SS type A sorting domain-containing protein [Saprospiraceae bacterium]|nr:T9SS type A sorting domain-containing protein [Saprospiraceae bacterium]
MKKIIIIINLIFVFVSVYSQEHHNHKRCGTVEHLEVLKQKDPELESRMKLIEAQTQEWIKNNQDQINSTKAVITIPVVVHVVYRTTAENISDAQVFSQIDVLNEDYRRTNSDASSTPTLFKPVAADVEIEFCMAQQTPQGTWFNGITRTQTTVSEFYQSSDNVKFSSQGGHDAWDKNKYLNIWVCNLEGGLLGYAQMPGGAPITDGVVILYSAFGRVGAVQAPYNKGRSATHEVGHWLNLYHVWGDDGGACWGSDNVNDTPNQADENYGCPSFPQSSCSNTSDMFMNYMDYTDDACMNIFTQGQKERMLATMNGARIYLKTSPACNILGVDEVAMINEVSVFPNPTSSGIINLKVRLSKNDKMLISVFNVLGENIYNRTENNISEFSSEIDLSKFNSGIYIVKVTTSSQTISRKISII